MADTPQQTALAAIPLQRMFPNLLPLLAHPAPFRHNWSEATQLYYDGIPSTPILVVGAGGLGSEIVKNLALSGVRNMHLVDMDTIDYTNLNRQFMFREKDIGLYKADVVAEFVRKRCPGVQITTYKNKVQDLPYSFYTQFPIIVGGLDNVEARKYLNKIVFLINQEEMDTVCYYLDGATQGFEGQALLVDPYRTSCYECSLLEGLANQPKPNYCTIANKPRTPEHCIQYVLEKQWEQERKGQARDNDDLEHLSWVYEKALARAKEFGIEGVTPMLALGITKNVIPAIASTNALIAAVTTNQVFKILSGCNPTLNNYLLYKGGTFIGSETEQLAKKATCEACLTRENRLKTIKLKLSPQQTFAAILEAVKDNYSDLNRPFVDHDHKILMNPGDSERYDERLNSQVGTLVSQGRIRVENRFFTLLFTDKCLKSELLVEVELS